MRKLTSSAVVACSLLAATAAAQPRAEMCGVTFVRAPDDVRHEIERWLAAEPRCGTPLELRVVATDGGLYLWAQRPDGRVHERLVPDAATAGVLVASWAADTWTDSPPLVPPPVVETITPAPSRDAFVDAAPRARQARGAAGQWISFGLASDDKGREGGFRGSVDVVAYRGWRFGVVGQYSLGRANTAFLVPDGYDTSGVMSTVLGVTDAKLAATVTRAVTWGNWELGATLGAGVLRTSIRIVTSDPQSYSEESHEKTTSVLEASAMLTHRWGQLGVGFGPLVTRIDQDLPGDAYSPIVPRRELQLLWFGALRWAM